MVCIAWVLPHTTFIRDQEMAYNFYCLLSALHGRATTLIFRVPCKVSLHRETCNLAFKTVWAFPIIVHGLPGLWTQPSLIDTWRWHHPHHLLIFGAISVIYHYCKLEPPIPVPLKKTRRRQNLSELFRNNLVKHRMARVHPCPENYFSQSLVMISLETMVARRGDGA